ncbi:hypothetical protein [Actinoplanes palleronii]|uniref:Minor tail protein n=1 Tax=Actinoplanes palleronii TaxID=113570 RepID=A0ABQ4B562_9ACTN|nr:hypothetical protein [Actinoplanes palleronii]GIE65410.1 hypothetical protein Apa02nite_015180 [Actinoplanes palleronii]
MAFPTTPLPLFVGLAVGADPVNPAGWEFADISNDVRARAGVSIQVGRQDESDLVDATKVGVTLDNRAGRYSRVNPISDLYGLLDKGTPIQVRVTRIVDTFTRSFSNGLGTEPNSGFTWTHVNPTCWNATGSAATCTLAAAADTATALVADAAGHDVEVLSTVSVPAVMTGASWVHATVVRRVDGSNQYRLYCEFTTAGTVAVKIAKVSGGVNTDLTGVISTGVTYSAGTRIRVRARAIGATLQIRCWLESGPEPTGWHAQVDDDDVVGTLTGLFSWRVTGNTNAGSLTATIDDFRMDVIRATTPVPEWPVRWDQSGKNVVAPVVGAGILRRLGQGQPALRSPIFRQLSAQPVCGYWPLEDGSDSTRASSAVVGGVVASGAEVTFGNDDRPPGAASAAVLTTGGGTSYVTGTVKRWTQPQTGYAVMCYFRLPTLPVSGAPLVVNGNRLMRISAVGTVVRWVIYATSGGFYIEGYANDGSLTVNTGSFSYVINPLKWTALQLEAEETGGTVNWRLLWYQVGATDGITFLASGSYSGTADRVTAASLLAPVDSTGVSHLWAGHHTLAFLDVPFMRIAAGYAGETAGARLARLHTENGIPFALIGSESTTSTMGAQPVGTFIDLVRDCEQADQGVLYERGAGLGYLPRRSRYNQNPAMVLDFAAGHVSSPPEPTDDDQRLRNRITVSRPGGSEVIAEVLASIARSGVYADEVEINVETDAQLDDHATWRLHLGTIDELRWPRITLDLARNPGLIAAWCKVRVGSRITIANPPSAVAGQDLDLIVEGWTENLSIYSWDVELSCSPARPWDVAVYDDPGSRRDSTSSTLAASVNSTATSLSITTPNLVEAWTTKASAYPLDLNVGGERITVTSAMSAPSGTGPYTQTAPVTRSVNGIVKSQAAGTKVSLWKPLPRAL